MLTPYQIQTRSVFVVNGSFIPALMAGDGPAINRQWREKVGIPVEPLEQNWPMALGSHVEPLALDWHERKTGKALTRRGDVIGHPQHPKVGVTLDAYRAADNWNVQVKVCGGWQTIKEIMDYYTCQAMIEAECLGADGASILLVHGGAEPTEIPIFVDDAYRTAVWARIGEFVLCVENMIEPFPTHIPKVIPPEQWRQIDLFDETPNAHNWSAEMIAALQAWDATADAAKANAESKEAVKAILPDDVGRVGYHGIVVSRSRSNAVTIRRRKEAA